MKASERPCNDCGHVRRNHFFGQHPERSNLQAIHCNQCGKACGATQRSDAGLYHWLRKVSFPDKEAEYKKAAYQSDRAMRILRKRHQDEYNRILLDVILKEG